MMFSIWIMHGSPYVVLFDRYMFEGGVEGEGEDLFAFQLLSYFTYIVFICREILIYFQGWGTG